MTGTGAAAGPTELGELRVELRAVNGRGLQLKQRLCHEVAGLEAAFEEAVRAVLQRGTITLVVDRVGAAPIADRAALQQIVADLRQLARDVGLPDDLSLRDVLSTAASLRGAAAARQPTPRVVHLLQSALADLQTHRAQGGAATVAAMLGELDALERMRQQAAARAPELVADYRERLLLRVREFVAAQGLQLTAADVVREVALFAERADVGEELQRLHAHTQEARTLLRTGGGIGRKLEFLLQEILRETNTLGAKSPDVAMAHTVVAMKAAVDRLKEQAANLE